MVTGTTNRPDTILGIRFCERCRGSVPEAEFHEGRALHVGNKDIHVDCLLRRSRLLPALSLILALYGAGVATWLLLGGAKPPREEGVSDAVRAEITRQNEESRRVAATTSSEAAERAAAATRASLESTLKSLRQEIAGLGSQMDGKLDAAVRASSGGLLDRLSKIEATLSALETRQKASEELGAKFNSLAQTVADLRKDVLALKAQVTPPPGGTSEEGPR